MSGLQPAHSPDRSAQSTRRVLEPRPIALMQHHSHTSASPKDLSNQPTQLRTPPKSRGTAVGFDAHAVQVESGDSFRTPESALHTPESDKLSRIRAWTQSISISDTGLALDSQDAQIAPEDVFVGVAESAADLEAHSDMSSIPPSGSSHQATRSGGNAAPLAEATTRARYLAAMEAAHGPAAVNLRAQVPYDLYMGLMQADDSTLRQRMIDAIIKPTGRDRNGITSFRRLRQLAQCVTLLLNNRVDADWTLGQISLLVPEAHSMSDDHGFDLKIYRAYCRNFTEAELDTLRARLQTAPTPAGILPTTIPMVLWHKRDQADSHPGWPKLAGPTILSSLFRLITSRPVSQTSARRQAIVEMNERIVAASVAIDGSHFTLVGHCMVFKLQEDGSLSATYHSISLDSARLDEDQSFCSSEINKLLCWHEWFEDILVPETLNLIDRLLAT